MTYNKRYLDFVNESAISISKEMGGYDDNSFLTIVGK